jgi:predicted nucleic acid-binding Zn ribbon protein
VLWAGDDEVLCSERKIENKRIEKKTIEKIQICMFLVLLFLFFTTKRRALRAFRQSRVEKS